MTGNITKTIKRTKITGLFYNKETKQEEEREAYIYTGADELSISMADAMAQNPGLIEILGNDGSELVTIGMSMDNFLKFREIEKVKKSKD